MYTVAIQRTFSAAHSLREYMGKCESLHGHNWKVEIEAGAEEPDKLGMVVDFTVMKKHADEILNQFDHTFLNEVPPFDTVNPSSENMARVIFEQMSERINDGRVKILSVTVWESEHSKASYYE